MPISDRTSEFRRITQEKQDALPEAKRRKITRPYSADPAQQGQAISGKQYLTEAYTILKHIQTLTRMLGNIRKPYLNVDSRNTPLSRQTSRNIDFGATDAWANDIRYLSNEERDQIDLQARVILSRCADRVKEMEAIEKRRTELVAKQSNPFTRFLPARLTQDASTLSSDVIAAHHSSITWYLSRRLAEASQSQKEMQEERVKRQLERTRTLGSGAAREAVNLGVGEPPRVSMEQLEKSGRGSWFGDASSSLIAAAIGAPSPHESHRPPVYVAPDNDIPPSDDEDDEIELSQSQILQFETENANILRTVQHTLESVQQAESRLMDISALQMELVTHLTRQEELANQLQEDAIATTLTVEKGNEQLKEAKRRARDGRKWILLFLIGASLSLLFLHFY